jgi:hypothetical protein
VLPGIPVFCITTRYDLAASGVCRPAVALFWGNVAPWLVSWIFSSSGAFASLLVWTSLVAGSAVNFVAPAVVYRAALRAQIGAGGGDESALAPGPEENFLIDIASEPFPDRTQDREDKEHASWSEYGVFPSSLKRFELLLTTVFLALTSSAVCFCIVYHITLLVLGDGGL